MLLSTARLAAGLALVVALTACPATPSSAVLGVTIVEGDQTLEVGDSVALTAQVDVSGSADTDVSWSSEDPSIASVDAAGVVTAVAAGTTTVTASSVADPTVEDFVAITVVAPPTIALYFAGSADANDFDAAVDQLAGWATDLERLGSWEDFVDWVTTNDPDIAIVFGGSLAEPTALQVDSLLAYLLDGGRLVFHSWRFDPAVTSEQTIRLADLMGVDDVANIPSENLDAVAGFPEVELEYDEFIGDGLPEPLVVPQGPYIRFAAILTPKASASSICTYVVPDGGSCAVRNASGTALVVGAAIENALLTLTVDEFATYLERLLRAVW